MFAEGRSWPFEGWALAIEADRQADHRQASLGTLAGDVERRGLPGGGPRVAGLQGGIWNSVRTEPGHQTFHRFAADRLLQHRDQDIAVRDPVAVFSETI